MKHTGPIVIQLISVIATERSYYGVSLSLMFLFFIYLIFYYLTYVLSGLQIFSGKKICLLFLFMIPLIFFSLIYMLFGGYFNGGTAYYRFYPLILSGEIQFWGYVVAAFYTLVISVSLIIVTERK